MVRFDFTKENLIILYLTIFVNLYHIIFESVDLNLLFFNQMILFGLLC